MYKVDFEAERKCREELNDERLQLQEKLIAVDEQLQALRLATGQVPEHQLQYGYAAGRRGAGPVVAQETPPPGGDVYQPRRIAQEITAPPAHAAAVPAATATPAEAQSPNRPPAEVLVLVLEVFP